MRRVVLDANVLISALLAPGSCRSVVLSLEEDKFEMAWSTALFEEFLRAVEKPKLIRLIPSEILEGLISLIHMKALMAERNIRVKACRDPKDDAVLECAVAGDASVIVTGDKDLLAMKSFRGISIVTPREFLRSLKKSS